MNKLKQLDYELVVLHPAVSLISSCMVELTIIWLLQNGTSKHNHSRDTYVYMYVIMQTGLVYYNIKIYWDFPSFLLLRI